MIILAFVEFNDFFSDVKENKISNVYLFYGEEGYYINGSVKQIINAVVNGESEVFNLNKFSGDNLSFDELSAALEQLPVFSERKCVVVSDFCLPAKADEVKALLAVINNIPTSSVLVLAMTPYEVNLKKETKLKSFAQKVAKVGTVVCFDKLSPAFIKKTLAQKAKKRGVVLKNDAADLLIQRCGLILSPLLLEIEKQINYCENGEITVKSVSELTVKTTEENVFNLGKLILSKNSDAAFTLLQQLFIQKITAINIISILNMVYLDLYRAYFAKQQWVSYSDAAKEMGYWGKEFRMRYAYNDCAKFSKERLSDSLQILMKADTALKSSRLDDKIIVEKTLAKLMQN